MIQRYQLPMLVLGVMDGIINMSLVGYLGESTTIRQKIYEYSNVQKLTFHCLPIGAWSMDNYSSAAVSIEAGLTIAKVIAVWAMVRNDSGSQWFNLYGANQFGGGLQGNVQTDLPNERFLCKRPGGSTFDDTDYSSLLINRGYVFYIYNEDI